MAVTANYVELHGHRGARGLTPDNMLGSFREARRHKGDCIEIDVGMSSDGKVVVHYDLGFNPGTTRLNGVWSSTPTPLKDQSSAHLRDYHVGRPATATSMRRVSPTRSA